MIKLNAAIIAYCLLVVLASPSIQAADELRQCDPEPTDIIINVAEIVGCEINPASDSDIFRFAGTAGDTIQLTVTDLTFGSGPIPVAQIFDPDQELLDTLSQNEAGDSRQLKLVKTGTYTVLVSDDGNNDAVGYNLALQRLSPPSPEAEFLCHGCTLEAAIDHPADSDVALFDGVSGDTIQLTVTDLTFGSGPIPVAQIFDPDQELLDTLSQNEAGDSRQLKLVKTGTYTVLVSDDGNNDAVGYNLDLQCLFGSCTNPLTRPPMGGSVTGFLPINAVCRNDTTGQTVTIPLESVTSWNCEAAGLIVNDGDMVFTGAEGKIGAEIPPGPPEVLGIFSETAEPRLTPGEDAFIGTFEGGDASFGRFAEDTVDVQEGTLSISSTIVVNASGGGFAGWFVSSGTEAQAGDNSVVRDMSAYTNGRLTFWVKSPINLEVGIRSGNVSAGAEQSKILLSQVSGFDADNTWRQVCIPLASFAGSAPKADLSQIKVFFVIASNTPSGGTDGQSQTFLIDDIRWETVNCP